MEETADLSFVKKKAKFNPKAFLYASSIAIIFVCIVLMTIPNLVFDPLRLFRDQEYFFNWLANCLILVGIEVPSMLLMESMSKDYYKGKEGGLYQARLSEFIRVKEEKVEPLQKYLSDYFVWKIPLENIKNRTEFLIVSGVKSQEAKYIARHCDISDLPLLPNETLKKKDESGNDIYIMKVPAEYMPAVEYALKGGVDVKDTDFTQYVYTDDENEACMSILDACHAINKSIARIKVQKRLVKIVSVVIFSAVWTMFIFEKASDGMGEMQVWMNLLSRLLAMVTGAAAGWGTSAEVVKQLSKRLETKTSVLKMFVSDIEDGSFVPESYDEKAKKDYEDSHKEVTENGEQRDNETH